MPESRHFAALPAALILFLAVADGVAAQSWKTINTSRQLAGESDLSVEVNYGVGHLQVRPAAEGLLYRMRLHYDEDVFEPRTEFDGRRLVLGLEGVNRGDVHREDQDPAEMDLELARGVPMDLELRFGAVRADVDLGGLSLTDLDIATGASESEIRISRPNPVLLEEASFEVGVADFRIVGLGNLNAERIDVDAGLGDLTLDFTGDWRRNAEVDVDLGLGSIELRIPRGLGVRLRKSGLLISLDSEGLIKRGDWYLSPDWEEADRRITVRVDGALGNVRVVWVN